MSIRTVDDYQWRLVCTQEIVMEVDMAHLTFKIKTPGTDIVLSQGKIWRVDGDLKGEMIECLDGTLWVTQKDDLVDYFLNPGERFWVTRPGTVVVQALRGARFSCSRGKPHKREAIYAHLGHE
jgi:hypothetical protein